MIANCWRDLDHDDLGVALVAAALADWTGGFLMTSWWGHVDMSLKYLREKADKSGKQESWEWL